MDRPLTWIEHLEELRKRIIISLIILGIASVGSLPFAQRLLEVLKWPAKGTIEKLAFFSPQEAFLIYMRVALLSGLVVSMPIILYQVWAFIAPAIEERLKKRATSFILFCFTAFITGIFFAYFMLIPPALKFLLSFANDQLEPVISAGKYISFVVSLILASGVVFQMPVLSLVLTKLGIITPPILRKKYKYAIVIIFIVAAIITPTPDAFNMLILALPMLFLFEVSIWVSVLAQPKVKPKVMEQ